jgi:hypothetical protein
MVGTERGICLEQRFARKALGLAEIAALKGSLRLVLQLPPFRLPGPARRTGEKQQYRRRQRK